MGSEEVQILIERNEALLAGLREVDYLISYGEIRLARERIADLVGEKNEQ